MARLKYLFNVPIKIGGLERVQHVDTFKSTLSKMSLINEEFILGILCSKLYQNV